MIKKRRSILMSDPITQLKGVAILLVVWWHVHQTYLQVKVGGYEAAWLLEGNGRLGVWIFFIVSGYLIGKGFFTGKYPLTIRGIFTYFINRFLSIIPYFLLTALVLYFLYRSSDVTITANLRDALLLKGNIHIQEHEIGYLWYISTLIKLYILAPVLFLIIRQLSRLRRFQIPAVILFLGFIIFLILQKYVIYSQAYVDPYSKFYYGGVIPNLGLFLSGFVLNTSFMQEKLKKLHPFILLHTTILKSMFIFLFLLLYISANYVMRDLLGNFFRYSFVFMLLLPFLTCLLLYFYLSLYESKKRGDESARIRFWNLGRSVSYVLGILGTYSYLIYLIHVPFLNIARLECTKTCSLTELSTSFLLTIGFCVLLSFFIEGTIGKIFQKARR